MPNILYFKLQYGIFHDLQDTKLIINIFNYAQFTLEVVMVRFPANLTGSGPVPVRIYHFKPLILYYFFENYNYNTIYNLLHVEKSN